MRHTWRPESWSAQARKLAEQRVLSVEFGYTTIEEAMIWFSISYRAPLIRQRAAKRFGRLVRAGKVKEGVRSDKS